MSESRSKCRSESMSEWKEGANGWLHGWIGDRMNE